MREYKMQMATMVSEPRWEFDFTIGSDAMAIEYATKVIQRSQAVHAAALSVRLYRLGDDEACIGDFVLDAPIVRNKLS